MMITLTLYMLFFLSDGTTTHNYPTSSDSGVVVGSCIDNNKDKICDGGSTGVGYGNWNEN